MSKIKIWRTFLYSTAVLLKQEKQKDMSDDGTWTVRVILSEIILDLTIVLNFAIGGVKINFWIILVKGLEKNLSVNCYDKKGDLSEIIGHSNYLCNHCIDSLHSMAVIKNLFWHWQKGKMWCTRFRTQQNIMLI